MPKYNLNQVLDDELKANATRPKITKIPRDTYQEQQLLEKLESLIIDNDDYFFDANMQFAIEILESAIAHLRDEVSVFADSTVYTYLEESGDRDAL